MRLDLAAKLEVLGTDADFEPSEDSSDPSQGKEKGPASRAFRSGETRTRTGDTTIFSRVLYQLSYLAVGA